MFFESERIPAIREMIIAKTPEQRKAALDKLLPMQRGDFEGIFKAMEGLPVTIRLLDPPLHEFLPHNDEDIFQLSKEMHVSFADIKAAVDSLAESNPMFGHRGCRLAVTYPEIAEMQTRAIIEAAINVSDNGRRSIVPEIMIPLVGDEAELRWSHRRLTGVITERGANETYGGHQLKCRALLTADRIIPRPSSSRLAQTT